ncbi:MAG: SWIM zinc finger family protein [Cyanobacteria bacterium P01_A01_bin.17]
MALPNITISSLKDAATDKSFARGESYFRSGAVRGLTLRQQTLYAEVEGNEPQPYRVTVALDGAGVTEARCSCPYSFGGWCKHIVATLLVCVHQPETVEERPPLSQLLEQLSLFQAKELIQSLVSDTPALLESVDFYVSTLAQTSEATSQKASPKRRTKVDPAPYQRRVREIFREAVSGWEYGQDDDNIAYDMSDLMQEAIAFAQQGDSDSALLLLKAITEASVQYWYIVEDFVGMSPDEFDIDFDTAWAEVLLSTELSEDEVLAWQEEIEVWQDSLGSFAMALEALRQGWDYPPLLRVFRGEITEKGAWSGEAPDWADDFSQIRLSILDRQERYEDYLHLAEAEGQTQAYLTMLGRLGRVDQAMTAAQEQITTLQQAKALAETLRSQERFQEALQIAIQGLRLEDDSNRYLIAEFALWTRSLAEGLGDLAAALKASLAGFKAKPSLKEYQKIQALSGGDWPDVRAQLLDQLRKMDLWHEADAQIDILLHENLVDDAVKKVSRSRLGGYKDGLTLRVMDAAISSHSQWIIDSAVPRAETIMDEGRSKDYGIAIKWLKRAKAAYSVLGLEDDWLRYRRQLVDAHGRKRKLMSLFEQDGL